MPWTSWRAAANHWPNAGGGTSTQAESSGQSVFAHEFSHLRGLPDNYNNPFADNERNFTGYWEMMSRGTFNGPGGTHNRWQVPNAGGSGLGPHHMLHFKNQLGVLGRGRPGHPSARRRWQGQGAAVVRVKARESVPERRHRRTHRQLGRCDDHEPDPQPVHHDAEPVVLHGFDRSWTAGSRLRSSTPETARLPSSRPSTPPAGSRSCGAKAPAASRPLRRWRTRSRPERPRRSSTTTPTGTFNATVGEGIPAFSLSQAQGDAVIALVNAGPVTMELVGRGGDFAGSCAKQGLDSFYCPGTGYLAYRFEVVDRVGNDSFAPGHGVLLSKSRSSGTADGCG